MIVVAHKDNVYMVALSFGVNQNPFWAAEQTFIGYGNGFKMVGNDPATLMLFLIEDTCFRS